MSKLKALMLGHEIATKRAALEKLQETAKDLEQREADLAAAIEEVETEEQREAVETEVAAFEADKAANEEQVNTLSQEIRELEEQLEAEEQKQETPVELEPEENEPEEREEKTMEKVLVPEMNTRARIAQLVEREDVKEYAKQIRSLIAEKRAITNGGYTIPDVLLPILRENVARESKLYKHCNVVRVSGAARQVIPGTIPEAVWTEMCANLNELDITFDKVEVDGYKVGGFVAICNALLEDSDIDLLTFVMEQIAKGIALALDKAILYGTGTKMPTGILVEANAEAGKPRLVSLGSKSGKELFTTILGKTALAANDYHTGGMFWAMSDKTKTKLIGEAVNVNANGAFVSAVNDTMPIIGGAIETLNFIPDDVIIFGYDGLYLLAERAGVQLDASEHVQFLADNTVVKGTARYDGKVAVPGFVAMAIGSNAPASNAVTFAADTANASTSA
jgi:HK97 family phage major capsid protein